MKRILGRGCAVLCCLYLSPLCLAKPAAPAHPKKTVKRAHQIKSVEPGTINVCIPKFREELLIFALLEAREKGFFQKNGLKVDLVRAAGRGKRSKLMSKAGEIPRTIVLNSRTVDRAATMSPADPPICPFAEAQIENLIFLENKPEIFAALAPLAATVYGRGFDTDLLVPADSPARTLKDLKGKAIRLTRLADHIALYGMLREAGLSMKDIEPAWHVSPFDLLDGLQNGDINAAISYLPTQPYLLGSGKMRVLKSGVLSHYVLPRLPQSFLLVNRKFAAGSPRTVTRFMTALNQAMESLRQHPDHLIAPLPDKKKIDMAAWKPGKPVFQSAKELLARAEIVDMTGDPRQREQVVQAVNAYNDLIFKMEYTVNKTDLDSWFKATAPKKP
jgi:ABC-type nitrate/sulfonate/bicarbonate transport system substrate-binding protein